MGRLGVCGVYVSEFINDHVCRGYNKHKSSLRSRIDSFHMDSTTLIQDLDIIGVRNNHIVVKTTFQRGLPSQPFMYALHIPSLKCVARA